MLDHSLNHSLILVTAKFPTDKNYSYGQNIFAKKLKFANFLHKKFLEKKKKFGCCEMEKVQKTISANFKRGSELKQKLKRLKIGKIDKVKPHHRKLIICNSSRTTSQHNSAKSNQGCKEMF
jgi:CRISPR-associated protein Cas8b1/Cst1 subtype I-B